MITKSYDDVLLEVIQMTDWVQNVTGLDRAEAFAAAKEASFAAYKRGKRLMSEDGRDDFEFMLGVYGDIDRGFEHPRLGPVRRAVRL